MQEHRESSSEPNPLYGGIGRGASGAGSALYLIAAKSSINKREMPVLLQSVYRFLFLQDLKIVPYK